MIAMQVLRLGRRFLTVRLTFKRDDVSTGKDIDKDIGGEGIEVGRRWRMELARRRCILYG